MSKRKVPDGIVDCECCGIPVIGKWKCDGCRKSPCVKSSTWHCTGKYGHQCDGTVCPGNREEMAEWEADRAERAWRPRRSPGFVPFR